MKNKNNKWIFAILAFIIIAFTLIYIGSIVTEFSANYPGHEMSLFGALLLSYFPNTAALVAVLYFVKFMIERGDNDDGVWNVINIVRSCLGAGLLVLYVFRAIIPAYAAVSLVVGILITVLFAVELTIWLVGLRKNKKKS